MASLPEVRATLVTTDLGEGRIDQHDGSPVFGGSPDINAAGDVEIRYFGLAPDVDGLDHLTEQGRLTSPVDADSDRDGRSDFVESGQTLCIVEAMKLMNEIECDVSGMVVRVLPENAQPVEYGESLFLVRPA